MLICDLSKAMQLLCKLIMQSSLLTLVVQYGTELADVPESRTLIFVGSLFFGPVSHNTTPTLGMSGVSLLVEVTGSRGGLAHALHRRAGSTPETTEH